MYESGKMSIPHAMPAPDFARAADHATFGARDLALLGDIPPPAMERLARHLALLGEWQKKINLVATATLSDAWRRHYLDSAQLYNFLPSDAETLIDLGSGAGFPGFVLAILAEARARPLAVHLIDSDRRKCAFLQAAIAATGARARVLAERIETVAGGAIAHNPATTVVTARAVAALADLVPLAHRFIGEGGTALFLKGAGVERELADLAGWTMSLARHPSRSGDGTILAMKGFRYAGN